MTYLASRICSSVRQQLRSRPTRPLACSCSLGRGGRDLGMTETPSIHKERVGPGLVLGLSGSIYVMVAAAMLDVKTNWIIWMMIATVLAICGFVALNKKAYDLLKSPRVLKPAAVIAGCAFVAWLGWPWPRVQSQFQSGMESEYQPGVDSTSTYWSGYMAEREALKVMGYYVALIRGGPESEVLVREVLKSSVEEGRIPIRWKPITSRNWRYEVPKDSLGIIFEVEKYGPIHFDQPKLFEREYFRASLMVLSRAKWKEPDWKIPDFK